HPPDWVFAPVWTLLYALIAVAGWRVWRKAGWRGARKPLTLYAAQLVLNLGWSIIFFGLQNVGLAFAEILVLLALIVATARAFRSIDRIAALLFVPYAIWVTFAAVLNGAILFLNG
ncbi:MAG: TspO/MBR family protein, partial [Rhodospirillaceae bacterium]